MKMKILVAAVALLSLPLLAAATNYDVAIEACSQKYMCLDSKTGAYFVKIGELELAGHSKFYSYDGIYQTVVQMYSQNIMCTGQYDVSKTKGCFTVHGLTDVRVKDNNIEDSGLCAVANKPPDIISVYATVPKELPTMDIRKRFFKFEVVGLLNDESTFAPGLEWELESNCFETVSGTGNEIHQTFYMFDLSKKSCKFNLTVEDAQEGYAFAEFFVPAK
jgi:hypothetical protein